MSRCWCCGKEMGVSFVAVCRECVAAGGTVTKKCRDWPHKQRRFKGTVMR
jgi:ribosomal protein L40E